ncbi:hypothetical protein SLS60_002958 [Paraconiothyrium brasiliense]|uniref:Uncharacterized protein n=1 Tax=Paraconiothyrium brasiliense TaxID=300254 RepID=A0ABR3RUA2_9PLEO
MPLSAEEIMTYFPMHLKWYPIAVRLHSHGWTASNICHYIYWSRELKQKSTLERTRVQHMLARAGDHYKEKNPGTFKPEAIPANPSLTERTATSRLSPAAIHNYYLVDLAEGVKHHPEDRGRLGLTHAIEHACANGNNTVLLSQAHEYVVEHALFDITAEYDCNVEDLPARQRVHTKVSAYFSNLFGVSGASRGQRKVKETNAGNFSFTETSEGDETNAKTSEDMDANKRPLELSSREDPGSGTQDGADSGKNNNSYEEE